MSNKIELNVGDALTVLEMANDLEAYYRSDIYVEHNDLATVGAKMRNVQKVKKILKMPESERRMSK